jgi:hypothetical protein
MVLDDKMTQWAQEIVGSYLPPIPSQGSKAATDIVDQARQREAAIAQDNLEAWLKQVALVIAEMTRRMLNKDSDDEYAQAVRAKLLGENAKWFQKMANRIGGYLREKISALEKIIPPPPTSLTEEELEILIHQPVVQTVTEFTEFAAQQRAAFAASVQNNPLFNQAAVARYMAAGVPNSGAAFVDSIVTPEGDTTSITAQQRQQQLESTTMLVTQQPVPVVLTDAHVTHYDVLVGPLEQAIMGGQIGAATAGLQHLSAHYAAGTQQKNWPPDRINKDKSQIARLQAALEAKTQEVQQAQAQQQMQAPQMPAV